MGQFHKNSGSHHGRDTLAEKTVNPIPTPTPDHEPVVVEDGYPKIIPVFNNSYAKAEYFRDEAEFSKYFDILEAGSSIYKSYDGIKTAYV